MKVSVKQGWLALLLGAGVVVAAARGPAQSAGSGAKAAAPAKVTDAAKLTAADFTWMSGSWQLGAGADVTEEHWMLPNGGSLLGMSRRVRGGKTAAFEFLRVEETKEGVDYVAQPGGRPPVRFRCTSLTGRKAVFENPQHDFPTTITYERNGDELIAAISGPASSTEKPETYRYLRAGDEVRLPD